MAQSSEARPASICTSEGEVLQKLRGELWRRLRDAGYGGSQRVVREWAAPSASRHRGPPDRPDAVTAVPSARTIARLLTSERDGTSIEAVRVGVAIETASPRIVPTRNLLDRFRTMMPARRGRAPARAPEASAKLSADETTAPVLDPGRVRTKTGQLWACARDDRPWGGTDPPAVACVYAPTVSPTRPRPPWPGNQADGE